MSQPRALLLAAGESRRLRPLTNEIPKTLLLLNGKTILSHIVACCLKSGLHRFSIVTGHGQAKVQEECSRIQIIHPVCEFSYIHCSEYGKMGNVYSLYLARELFQEPLILINSDLVFSHQILATLLASPKPDALVIDDHKKLGSEEMKVAVRNGIVTSIKKNLDPATAIGEYIGMTKMSPAIAQALEASLYYVVNSAPDKYYEDAFQHAVDHGVDFHKVSTGGAPCMEIDTFEDLDLARANAHLWV